MKSHLSYISAEYDQQSDSRGVHPISLHDCKVITLLIGILKNKDEHQLATILELWKDVSDDDVMKSLTSYSKGVVELPEMDHPFDEDDDRYSISFIEVRGNIFIASKIYSIHSIDGYDNIESKPCYDLVINKGPIPAKEEWYTDTVVRSYTREGREELLKDIKQKLVKTFLCKFI